MDDKSELDKSRTSHSRTRNVELVSNVLSMNQCSMAIERCESIMLAP